jgi:hypothetical protein
VSRQRYQSAQRDTVAAVAGEWWNVGNRIFSSKHCGRCWATVVRLRRKESFLFIIRRNHPKLARKSIRDIPISCAIFLASERIIWRVTAEPFFRFSCTNFTTRTSNLPAVSACLPVAGPRNAQWDAGVLSSRGSCVLQSRTLLLSTWYCSAAEWFPSALAYFATAILKLAS